MSRDRYSAGYASANNRPPVARALAFLCLLAALTMLVLTATGNPIAARTRTLLLDLTSPVIDWISTPVTGVRSLIRDKNRLLNAFEENKQLREEADALRRWQAVAQALKAENDSLRSLAGYQPVEEAHYVTARVVGQSPDTLSASLIINAGSAEGVKELQPVIDAYGMVGRITELGEHTSRVLLLTDSTSRVPIVTADARVHAILSGTGSNLMSLTFVGADQEKITIGEHVVTTEEGGLIPGGINIGSVFKRDAQGLFVKPTRPLAQSEYVRVVVTK